MPSRWALTIHPHFDPLAFPCPPRAVIERETGPLSTAWPSPFCSTIAIPAVARLRRRTMRSPSTASTASCTTQEREAPLQDPLCYSHRLNASRAAMPIASGVAGRETTTSLSGKSNQLARAVPGRVGMKVTRVSSCRTEHVRLPLANAVQLLTLAAFSTGLGLDEDISAFVGAGAPLRNCDRTSSRVVPSSWLDVESLSTKTVSPVMVTPSV